MGRVFVFKGVGVYVNRESGHHHHLPHAHAQRKGECLGTFILPTLTPVARPSSDLPSGIVDAMGQRMDDLMAEWSRLNSEEH